MASIAECPRTFIHSISYSSLSLIFLSVIYALLYTLQSALQLIHFLGRSPIQLLVLYCLAQRPHLSSLLQLLAIQLKPQQLKHCVTRNVVSCLITRQQSPPRKRPLLNSTFTISSNYTPIISYNLTFSPVRTLSSLFYASLSTISPAIVEFCFVISSIVCLAFRPQMARLVGTAQTSTSTSGTASIVKRPRTFVHSVFYSSLSLISLSITYTLILLLYSFFMAYILWVSRGPTAQSLCTRAQLFYFKASSRSAASPIRIVISFTSIGL